MSEVKQTMTNFNRQVVTVPAYDVASIDFMGVLPNYFRVQNSGSVAVYCSPNNIPTKNRYDFSVSGGGLSMYAEPNVKSKLHIYNPNGTPVNCTVITFAAEFDPIILALSNIEVDMPSSIETSNVIGGFATSLPAGSNKIGKVDVDNFPSDYAKATNQKDYTQALTDILNALGATSGGGGSGGSGAWDANGVQDVISALENVASQNGFKLLNTNGSATSGGFSVSHAANNVRKIITLSNDGEEALTIILTNYDGSTCDIVLNAGEVLNDVYGTFTNAKFVGSNVPFRYVYSVMS